MIRLEGVSKGYWVGGEFQTVIDHVSFTFPERQSIALLGRNGAGKSTLLEMIAGFTRPDTGSIYAAGSISWPVGYSSGIHRDMTGEQNTRFLGRVYGVDTDDLIEFVEDFSEIGKYFYMPVRKYSSGMKSRLAFGISMGIRFDTYLIDEVTAVGDTRFRRKSRDVFRNRMADSSAILVSHNSKDLRRFCDAAVVLHRGKLEYFDDLKRGIEYHEELSKYPA